MTKFLVDANLPFSSKLLLGDLGFNVLHVREADLSSASDELIFKYAQRTGRIILTRSFE